MQDQHVSVWVVEETHQADACIDGIPEKPDSLRYELLTGDVHVGYAQRDPCSVGRKPNVLGLGLPERKRHVSRLELVGVTGTPGQAEHLAIEPTRTDQIARWH